ncbi:MAG: hypothetical protein MJZ30_11670 [Paludibacteraceae bacterium]|nr:hypothetical protein [Paludibacteraceae bacterium]
MNVHLRTLIKPDFWAIIILPEIAIFRDRDEYGIEFSWLCWYLEITNK